MHEMLNVNDFAMSLLLFKKGVGFKVGVRSRIRFWVDE